MCSNPYLPHPLTLMSQHSDLTLPRIVYISLWGFIGLVSLTFEAEWLPAGTVSLSTEARYVLDLACIILTLAATWGALRRRPKASADESQHRGRACSLRRWHLIRCLGMGGVALLNILAYYLLGYVQNALFCLLISLTGLVCCWPKSTGNCGNHSTE